MIADCFQWLMVIYIYIYVYIHSIFTNTRLVVVLIFLFYPLINVGKTISCLPSPSHHHKYMWYKLYHPWDSYSIG